MNLAQRLRHWITMFEALVGERPAVMPMSKEELDILRCSPDLNEVGYYMGACINHPHVFGTDVFESPFGAEMRARQVQVPVEQVCVADKSSGPCLNPTLDTHRDSALGIMHRRLSAHVCKDTTKLSATFEFDPWAPVKRFLRVTRWFPVKTRTIEIDGRVLYPYLNITFPLNRHHVTFAVRE